MVASKIHCGAVVAWSSGQRHITEGPLTRSRAKICSIFRSALTGSYRKTSCFYVYMSSLHDLLLFSRYLALFTAQTRFNHWDRYTIDRNKTRGGMYKDIFIISTDKFTFVELRVPKHMLKSTYDFVFDFISCLILCKFYGTNNCSSIYVHSYVL